MTINSEPIVVAQTYNARIGDVWKAITEVDQMRQWFFNTIADFKPEVGFETAFDVECDGEVYPHLWKVTEVVPEERLAYGWRYGGYPGDSVVTWDLSETTGGTELKLTHAGGESFPQGTEVFSRESCEAGWKFFLGESLKANLESRG